MGKLTGMESLVDLVHSNNILTKPLGVNIWRKVRHERNLRLHFLVTVLWLDSLYTASLALIPTDQERTLMLAGDLAFMIFNHNRYFFFAVVLFYRISSAAIVTCFTLDDFSWITEASELFDQLKTRRLWLALVRLGRRCRTLVVVVVLARVGTIVSAHTMGAVINRHRDAKYFVVHSYLYTAYYAVMYSCVNFQFMIELYFLCKVCIAIFDELNQQFREALFGGQLDRFPQYYVQFGLACRLVHRVMSYVRPTFTIYFVCNLIVSIFLFYVGFYESEDIFSSTLFIGFALGEVSFTVFFSSVIGTIDVQAKHIADLVYGHYVLDAYNPFAELFRTKIQLYFHSIWGSTIGLVVLGNHINARSSIRIFTIVLTVMAFLISNFRKS